MNKIESSQEKERRCQEREYYIQLFQEDEPWRQEKGGDE